MPHLHEALLEDQQLQQYVHEGDSTQWRGSAVRATSDDRQPGSASMRPDHAAQSRHAAITAPAKAGEESSKPVNALALKLQRKVEDLHRLQVSLAILSDKTREHPQEAEEYMELLLRVGSTARRLQGTANALQEAACRRREAKRQLHVLLLQREALHRQTAKLQSEERQMQQESAALTCTLHSLQQVPPEDGP